MVEATRQPTALEAALTPSAKEWLTRYACERWSSLYNSLDGWRARMTKYAARAKDDFSDRVTDIDELTGIAKIFSTSNESLATVEGFADFAHAQTKEDILGSDRFFAAVPIGAADQRVSEITTKYAHWKWDKSNLVPQLKRSLRTLIDLGTAFPKATWRREIETYHAYKNVAIDARTGESISVAGQLVTDPSDFVPMPIDDEAAEMLMVHVDDESVQIPEQALEWQEMLVPQQETVFNNLEVSCINYKDIAFDPTAIAFDLIHTDVFHRFDIGLLDAVQQFKLSRDDYDKVLRLMQDSGGSEPSEQRKEQRPELDNDYESERRVNPPITLVEGYMRCDPFGRGIPVRIYVVMAPTIDFMLLCDFLREVTPKGQLPIRPLRCYQEENRVCGIGYHEKYAYAGDDIDEQYSAVKHRNKLAANPIPGIDYSALKEDRETLQLTTNTSKPFEMTEGRSMAEAITFAEIPDKNSRAIELLNIQMQMLQMRAGISSAAQGQLENLPSTTTATGVQALLGRANLLLADHIKDTRRDILEFLRYCFDLLMANIDQDEVFRWGEGDEAEILTMNADWVRELEFDMRLEVSQTLNQERLQNCQTAIGLTQNYLQVPEIWKDSVRPLYLQAMRALGFETAEQHLPHAINDPATLASSIPPDMQPTFVQAAEMLVAAQEPANDQQP